MDSLKRQGKKVAVGITGGLVLLFGLVLVPYPGPGWLIVFAGLGILSTEFEFAKRLLTFARKKYDAAIAWLKRQNIFIQLAALAMTGIVVLATVYLLNGFGILNSLLSLQQDWLKSPLFK